MAEVRANAHQRNQNEDEWLDEFFTNVVHGLYQKLEYLHALWYCTMSPSKKNKIKSKK